MNNRPRLRAVFTFVLLSLSSVAVALPTLASPAPQSIEPTFIGGSTTVPGAPTIQFNSSGGFYGVYNASSGGIEPIRGHLAWPAGPSSHYFKIDLPKGKILKAVVDTVAPTFFTDPRGVTRITPNFQVFMYTGIPSLATEIDWNTVDVLPGAFGGASTMSELPQQEVNILTPVGGGVPATYYLNVSIWY